jgi:ABC-2 type transport system permease protein
LQSGRAWLNEPLIPLVWSWFPILLVISVVTDSFAGERERNTLETLLSSRLSDQAILFGKISASVLYGWGISLISNLLAVVTVNVSNPGPGFQFYKPSVYLPLIVIPFLGCLLMSSLGVLVSLNAPTARAAYQRLSLVMLAVIIVPTLIVNFAGASVLKQIDGFVQGINWVQLGIGAAILALITDAVLIWVALQRFKRTKLILD